MSSPPAVRITTTNKPPFRSRRASRRGRSRIQRSGSTRSLDGREPHTPVMVFRLIDDSRRRPTVAGQRRILTGLPITAASVVQHHPEDRATITDANTPAASVITPGACAWLLVADNRCHARTLASVCSHNGRGFRWPRGAEETWRDSVGAPS